MTLSHSDKLHALVVHHDANARMLLKQATSSLHQFGKLFLFSSCAEAITKLKTGEHFGVIFLPSSLGKEEISEFIRRARGFPAAQDAAFVLIMGARDQAASTVATSMLQGVDGFLFQPYSVDALTQITEIASRVRLERARSRESVAMSLLVRNIMSQIDEIAYLKACGYEGKLSVNGLRETCSTLQKLPTESQAVFLDVAVNLFQDAPPPRVVNPEHKYKGPSQRVKQKVEKQVLTDIKTKTGNA
jgi:CheY-like chemotaxis protein